MSSWIVSNASISRLARGIVTIFDANRFNNACNSLHTGELESQFKDCKVNSCDYSTAKVAEKLYNMNLNAYTQRYGRGPYEPVEFKYEDGIDDVQKHYSNRHNKDNDYPMDLIPYYKLLSCYLYQCCEGDVDQSELYIQLRKLEDRMAAHIISRTEAYDKASWG